MRGAKITTFMSLILITGLTLGLAMASAPAGSTVKASIVAVDVDARTVTFRDDARDQTLKLPVEDGATKALPELEPGDQVTLTCRQSDDGKLVAITAIAKA